MYDPFLHVDGEKSARIIRCIFTYLCCSIRCLQCFLLPCAQLLLIQTSVTRQAPSNTNLLRTLPSSLLTLTVSAPGRHCHGTAALHLDVALGRQCLVDHERHSRVSLCHPRGGEFRGADSPSSRRPIGVQSSGRNPGASARKQCRRLLGLTGRDETHRRREKCEK